MKKYVNGECIELTESEIAEMEAVRLQYEAAERHRPLTIGEVAEMLVRKQINTLPVDDQTALVSGDETADIYLTGVYEGPLELMNVPYGMWTDDKTSAADHMDKEA